MNMPSDAKSMLIDVLESAESLSVEEQETLIEVLHRRLAESRRGEIVAEIQKGNAEFDQGHLRPVTPEQVICEILK